MKVCIVGSRDFPQMKQVEEYVNSLPEGTTVVSGGARGVDTVAEEAASKRGLQVEVFKADWERYGKIAGMIRNRTMLSTLTKDDKVVAFWDGHSHGTNHSISCASGLGLNYEVRTALVTPHIQEYDHSVELGLL